jgi:predicted permease
MGFSTIYSQVLVLFFIMLIGLIAKKKGIINDAVSKKLSEMLLKITSPLLVISSFQVRFTRDILDSVIAVFIFGLAFHAFSALLSHILFKKYESGRRKIMVVSTIYSNCGFMGFPILESLFGKIGILMGSVYLATFNIFIWTNGVMVFTDKKKLDRDTIKNTLLNPGMVSVAIGLLLFLFSIKLPHIPARTIELVGSMTVPLSMLIVGGNLTGINFKELIKELDLFYIAGIRLVLLPIAAYAALKLFGFSGTLLTICVLVTAMPVAAITTMFAEMYGGDVAFSSRVVAFSTLLSIITVPLIMLLH